MLEVFGICQRCLSEFPGRESTPRQKKFFFDRIACHPRSFGDN
jgi:uncharacterized metal-binding protein YceD (DUF177 family)